MALRHLHELLQEDQEPFQLKRYLADRRYRPPPRTDLQVKKRKPISKNPTFPSNFCESSCFFPGYGSLDPKKSPLFGFRSPGKSPNRVFLHVPAGTAAILLEAAARIQRESSSKNSKSKVRNRGNRYGFGFGLIGSVLKRLTHRNPTRKPELVRNPENVKLRLQNAEEERRSCSAPRLSCSSSGNRSRNAVLSQRILDDSDSEPSTSSRRESFGENISELGYGNADGGDSGCCDCDSPFRFVLQTSPSSSGPRTPHFTSPATSPTRHCPEDEDSDETESLVKPQEQEQEQEKEQCSPVSVLDPPFEEDRDGGDGDDDVREGDLDPECSFALVRRAKSRLLQKLRRFEQLAGLDPVELERRMSEQEQEEEENNGDDETITLYDSEEDEEELEEINEWISSDKFIEEEVKKNSSCEEYETDFERIWKKLNSWRWVNRESLGTVVERGFRDEDGEWKRNQEEVQETVVDIEFAVFRLLVEELSQELVSFQ